MNLLTPCPSPDLWAELQEATVAPESADLAALWRVAEAAISLVPEPLRLRVAGEAILQLAGVCEARAKSLLDEWEQAQGSGCSVTAEGLADLLLRQSMQVDLGDLVEVPAHKYNRVDPGEKTSDSMAAPVDKAALLEAFDTEIELVETQAQANSGAVSVAHSEDVNAWASAITLWFAQQEPSEPVSLVQLQQQLGMPVVEVWMGLLLSQEQQYEWQQQVEFYDPQGISVVILNLSDGC